MWPKHYAIKIIQIHNFPRLSQFHPHVFFLQSPLIFYKLSSLWNGKILDQDLYIWNLKGNGDTDKSFGFNIKTYAQKFTFIIECCIFPFLSKSHNWRHKGVLVGTSSSLFFCIMDRIAQFWTYFTNWLKLYYGKLDPMTSYGPH